MSRGVSGGSEFAGCPTRTTGVQENDLGRPFKDQYVACHHPLAVKGKKRSCMVCSSTESYDQMRLKAFAERDPEPMWRAIGTPKP